SSVMRELGLEWLTRFGWAGVDLFFVISGFLITGILLDTKDRPDFYRLFYLRRILRIWPLYFLLLAFAVSIGAAFTPDLGPLRQFPMLVAYLLFVQNLFFNGHFPMEYTWSVNVEEQFYIAWPFFVARFSRKALALTAGLLVIICPLLRWAAAAQE